VSTVVALALGVGADGVHAQDAGSATSATVELPRDIPEDIPSGSLDTPLGPARWVHLSGDAETLPDILRPVPVPGGYVSLDEGGIGYGPCPPREVCHLSAELWSSPDLLRWERRPLPVEADLAQLTLAGGQYWLTVNGMFQNEDGSRDQPSLWRSADTLAWESVDLTHLEPPPPAAIDWRVQLGTLAASGDTIVIPMTYSAQNATSFLGLPPHPDGEDKRGEYAGLEPIDDGSYRVFGAYGTEHDRVRFEETDGRLRVFDEETGDELISHEGIGMDFIERWAANGGLVPTEQRIAVVRDGRAESVELPDSGPGVVPWGLTLFGADGGLRAFQTRTDGLVQAWTSPDGTAWMLDEVVGDDPGEPGDVQSVWFGPDGLEAFSWDGVKEARWVSADGASWTTEGRPRGGYAARVGQVWVVLSGGGLIIHADDSPDGTVVEVGHLRLKTDTLGAGGVGMAAISANTIAHSVHEDERQNGWQRDHWIITFDDLPASEDSTTDG
jgi:hypothetical protein